MWEPGKEKKREWPPVHSWLPSGWGGESRTDRIPVPGKDKGLMGIQNGWAS